MKPLWKNKKALSPVVATIILVATAIAVTLATAGWLSVLTVSYTGTAAITVNNVQFTGTTGQPTNAMVLSLRNTGTKTVTIEMIKINGNSLSFSPVTNGNVTFVPIENKNLTINNVGWQSGSKYDIQIIGEDSQTVGAYQANSDGA